MKGAQVAFGHKADWDFSTGTKRADERLDEQASGKSLRLNGQTLALLGNTDWGHLRTEVPVNRHVTMEHACKLAHHSSASMPFSNTADRQSSPLKGRPGSAAVNPSPAPPTAPAAALAKSGKLLHAGSASLQLHITLSSWAQAPMGSTVSSPRSLSPNSYLARTG